MLPQKLGVSNIWHRTHTCATTTKFSTRLNHWNWRSGVPIEFMIILDKHRKSTFFHFRLNSRANVLSMAVKIKLNDNLHRIWDKSIDRWLLTEAMLLRGKKIKTSRLQSSRRERNFAHDLIGAEEFLYSWLRKVRKCEGISIDHGSIAQKIFLYLLTPALKAYTVYISITILYRKKQFS